MKVYQNPIQHEKRWDQLVGPLVPKDGKDRLFLDLGCNAGFYMVKAEELGYRAFGVEREQGFIDQAPKGLNITKGDINTYRVYKSERGSTFRRKTGERIVLNETPAAYITLLANVLYHQTDAQVESILRHLMYSSAYLLIMGRHKGSNVTSRPDRDHLGRILDRKVWKIENETSTKKFYAVLAKNYSVEERSVADLYRQAVTYSIGNGGHHDFFEPFADFVRRVITDDDKPDDKTAYWQYLRSRKFRYRHGLCFWYRHMVEEAIANGGILTALDCLDGRVLDGHHRLVIAKELGIKRLIVRQRQEK